MIQHPNAYNDIQGNIATALTGAAVWTTEQIRDTGFIINWLRHDQNDYFQQVLQMPHTKQLGTNLTSLHLHALPGASVDGIVAYSCSYIWVNVGDEIPAISSWNSTDGTFIVSGSDKNQHKIYPILTNVLSPISESYSSLFLAKIIRNSTSDVDTYTGSKDSGTVQANLGILYLDAHIKTWQDGSKNEYTD